MTGMVGGCDVGSTTGKAVLIADGRIVGSAVIASLVDPEQTAKEALRAAGASVPGWTQGQRLDYLIGTGYGRNEVPFADENVSEITCHAVGAHWCNPSVRTIIDVGGQDVKAVGLNADGTVREFAMNDKCAAGTGRFFEAMSRILRVDLENFSDLSSRATRVIPITSQCSVFAETEVVSLIGKRHAASDIAAGVQAAVAKRIFSLVKRVGLEPVVTMTGGCAHNAGLVEAVSKVLRAEIVSVTVDPQIVGALGAAVLAERRLRGPRGQAGGRS